MDDSPHPSSAAGAGLLACSVLFRKKDLISESFLLALFSISFFQFLPLS